MAATVRRLVAGDEATLQAISGRFKERDLDADSAAALLTRDDVVVLAVLDGGAPLGFALAYLLPRIDRPQAMMFVYELDVDEEHRRRGHGRALLEHLKLLCVEQGLMKMYISTAEDNEVAHTLLAAAEVERSGHRHLWFGWAEADGEA